MRAASISLLATRQRVGLPRRRRWQRAHLHVLVARRDADHLAGVLAAADDPRDHIVTVAELLHDLVRPAAEDLRGGGERVPRALDAGCGSLERRRVVARGRPGLGFRRQFAIAVLLYMKT
jgi:hypothetical protein